MSIYKEVVLSSSLFFLLLNVLYKIYRQHKLVVLHCTFSEFRLKKLKTLFEPNACYILIFFSNFTLKKMKQYQISLKYFKKKLCFIFFINFIVLKKQELKLYSLKKIT